MTSSNDKKAVRAIQKSNPGMKYTQALRVHESASVNEMPPRMTVTGETGWGHSSAPGSIFLGERTSKATPVTAPVSQNLLITGSTGSGKTLRLLRLITRAMLDGYEISTIEGAGRGELSGIDGANHLNGISSEEEVIDFLGKPRPGHILVIEDFPFLVKKCPAVEPIIDDFLAQGTVVIVAQSPVEIDPSYLELIGTKILAQGPYESNVPASIASALGISPHFRLGKWEAGALLPHAKRPITLAPEAL